MNSPVYNPDDNRHKFNQFKFYRTVCLIVAGYTKEEIAQKLQVSPRTLIRWFNEPAFQESLRFALSQTYNSAIAELTAHSTHAARKLIGIIDDEIVSDRVRIEAIKLLFDIVQKSRPNLPEPNPLVESILDIRNQISYFQSAAELAQIKPVELVVQDRINHMKKLWSDMGLPEDEFPDNDFTDDKE